MSKLTYEQVRAELDRTNINNIKHVKHNINNLNTINDFTSSDNQQMGTSSPLAPSPSAPLPASQPVGVALATSGTLPWRYLRADLFDNATPQQLAKNKRKLNLKLSFLLNDSPDYEYLAAALNTPWRNIKRGFDFSIPEDLEHYNLLEQTHMGLKNLGLDRVQSSKCYVPAKKGKGDTVYGFSVVIGQNLDTNLWHLILLEGTNLHELTLSNLGLTDNQRQANCIASGHQGEVVKRRKTASDFLRRK